MRMVLAPGVAILLTSTPSPTGATSYTSVTPGNWGNPDTWTPSGMPMAGDEATVTCAVTVETNHTCALLHLNHLLTSQPGYSPTAGGGTYGDTAPGSLNGAHLITQGTFSPSAAFPDFTVQGGSWWQNYGVYDHSAGTILWDGGTISGGTSADLNGTTGLVWRAGTLWGQLRNHGLLTLEGSGTKRAMLTASIRNDGPVRQLGSGFRVDGIIRLDGGTVKLALQTLNGGRLEGDGTLVVNGNVTCQNTVAPGLSAGRLTVAGRLTLGASSTLEIQFGGTMPGSEHDQVAATQQISVGGLLDVTLIDPFVPVAGDRFVVVTSPSCLGQFAATNLPALAAGLDWRVGYQPDSIDIRVADAQDTDGDGLPDAYEMDQFMGLGVSEGGRDDTDHDGSPDRDEWWVYTNPNDTNDFLRIKGMAGASITVDTSTGVLYHLERTDLNLPDPKPWTETDQANGTGGDVDLDHATAPDPTAIYRIRAHR